MPEYLHLSVNHGAMQFGEKRLQRHINEFMYRLSEGNVQIHTMDRINVLLEKTSGERLTYKVSIA